MTESPFSNPKDSAHVRALVQFALQHDGVPFQTEDFARALGIPQRAAQNILDGMVGTGRAGVATIRGVKAYAIKRDGTGAMLSLLVEFQEALDKAIEHSEEALPEGFYLSLLVLPVGNGVVAQPISAPTREALIEGINDVVKATFGGLQGFNMEAVVNELPRFEEGNSVLLISSIGRNDEHDNERGKAWDIVGTITNSLALVTTFGMVLFVAEQLRALEKAVANQPPSPKYVN